MINDKQRREVVERTRETEINRNTIMPGDVYEYSCGNDQGYGYMIPVKTSKGWDFIDTYHLGIPWRKDGESDDDASIRRIIELGHGKHDRYVRNATSSFYHCNAHFNNTEVPYGLRFVFNLGDYSVVSNRECEDYDSSDVVVFVPLYREQHFHWDSGRTRGLCFVKKDAKKTPVNEFKSLLADALRLITEPSAWMAASRLDEIKKKLRELEDLGLSTQESRDAVSRLAKRIEIINKCAEDLREIEMELMTQLCDSSNSGEEMAVDNESD